MLPSDNALAAMANNTLRPTAFYQIADLIQEQVLDPDNQMIAPALRVLLESYIEESDREIANLSRTVSALAAEIRNSSRRQNPFSTEQTAQDPLADLRNASGSTFVRVIYDVFRGTNSGFHEIRKMLDMVQPAPLMLAGDRPDMSRFDWMRDPDHLTRISFEMQTNGPAVLRFIDGVLALDNLKVVIIDLAFGISKVFDEYYAHLLKRHTVDGIEIHESPIITDIALSVYSNVDSHGEIERGRSPDEISAFSARKARLLIDFIHAGTVAEIISDPEQLVTSVKTQLSALWDLADAIESHVAGPAEQIRTLLGRRKRTSHFSTENEFNDALTFLDDLNPRNISYKEKEGLLTSDERFEREFTNETLRNLSSMLVQKKNSQEIVDYILQRKAKLRDYHEGENTFYTCRIGAGNSFLGEAPGALSVHPGTRPTTSIDEVVGSGFDQIRDFIAQIESTAKFHDLFVATSPSRSADKNNVLLIGPQGCGKSEVLRAVGADRDSVGIFAQGSDFLTCWMGEAQKNPKRLFEAAVKIQKSSKKHVHILIDEIDSILNDDPMNTSSVDLKTEFQILMDGVVRYPSLSIWGATNHPRRMPMPIIRRFAKVLVVGELDANDRRTLLKHFSGFLPLGSTLQDNEGWEYAVDRLEGATGDVVRKVVDHVWRQKMHQFVTAKPEKATQLVELLNTGEGGREAFDVAKFDAGKRTAFKLVLRESGVVVSKQDIDKAVDRQLQNVAVRAEIDTAVRTYAASREFLSDLQKADITA